MAYKIITDPVLIDRKLWSDFIHSHPNGSIFQTPEMFDAYNATKNFTPIFIACISEDSNDIYGIFISVIQRESKNIFGKFSARIITWAGPLINTETTQEVLVLILKKHNQLAHRAAIFSQIRNFWPQNDQIKEFFNKQGFTFIPHLNIIKKLPDNESDLWKGLKRSRKDGINKARKSNFVFFLDTNEELINDFYILHEELYRRIGLPISDKSFYISLLRRLPKENIKIFALQKDQRNIIILFSFLYNLSINVFSIGIKQDPEILKLRPVDLFYYEIMKWAIDNKIKFFDWMGAGNPNEDYGVRKFKLEYGGEVEEIGRYINIYNPLLMKIGIIGFKFYKEFRKQSFQNSDRH